MHWTTPSHIFTTHLRFRARSVGPENELEKTDRPLQAYRLKVYEYFSQGQGVWYSQYNFYRRSTRQYELRQDVNWKQTQKEMDWSGFYL